jgi:uncharacterized repeat protein (TIGR01451 family)
MRIRGSLLAAVGVALAVPAAASANVTLGTTTQPNPSTANSCPTSPNQILIESDGGSQAGPLTVPSSGPFVLTQWQVNASNAVPGAQLTLVVLRADFAAEEFTVVGTDTETLNPADGVETFNLSSPISVEADDLIASYSPGSTAPGISCYWSGGSTEDVEGVSVTGAPTTGEQFSPGAGLSSPDSTLNLSATLGAAQVSYDAGASLTAGPSNALVGQPAVLTATVTNHGPQSGAITFTDHVPSGMTIRAVGSGSGTCTTAAAVNLVTCTTNTLASGASSEVLIVVTPTIAETYKDTGSVSLADGGTDPNSANNTATASLTVSKPAAPPKCVVPKLGGASESLAKRLLPLLDCKVGKVKQKTSKSVAKGHVISTSPGAGSYAFGKSVGLTVSSGKPKPKKKKKKK